MSKLISLGIESTAHTFSVGIVSSEGKILANEKSIFRPPIGMGIVPREAAEYHIKNAKDIIKNAFKISKLSIKNIDIISFSKGPGLPNCLQVGASIARYFSLKYKKPLVPVNHCVGHIELGKLTTSCKDPVVLYLSGGNTQVLAFVEGYYRVFGECIDIPIGNALDCLARELGLKTPGGPEIEKLSKRGKWVDLPYVVKGMDVSFSGLLTNAIQKFKKGIKKEDICYSFQETCFAMLTEVTERALAHTDKREVLITGGVAANKRLKQMVDMMCKERGAKCYAVPIEYSGDNGAQIAWTGILAFKTGQTTKIEDSKINKDWRTDEVEIKWL